MASTDPSGRCQATTSDGLPCRWLAKTTNGGIAVCGYHRKRELVVKHDAQRRTHAAGRAAAVTMRDDFPVGCAVEHTRHPQRGVGRVLGFTTQRVTVEFPRMRWHYHPHLLRRVEAVFVASREPAWAGAPGSGLPPGSSVEAVLEDATQRVLLRRPDLLAVDVGEMMERVVARKLFPWRQWAKRRR